MLVLCGLICILFLFFTLFFHLPGSLFLSARPWDFDSFPRLLLSFGFSCFFWALLMCCGLLLGLPQSVLQAVLAAAMGFSMFRALKKGALCELGKHRRLFLLWFLFFAFALITAAYPRGLPGDVSPKSIQNLFDLPVDNIIPFNFSRYLVERIDPHDTEVVPSWSAVERGPLAGILTAAVFTILGLQEHAPWLWGSPRIFFVYEALLIYLNSLVFVAVWFLARAWFGKRSAPAALLACGSSYFTVVNLVFTWPKFFMAYFLLAAFMLFLHPTQGGAENKKGVFCGLFLALAMLAHDSAVFYLLSFFFFGGLLLLRKPAQALRCFGPILAALGAVLLPWLLYKSSFPSTSRLFYLQVFCSREEVLDGLSLRHVFLSYVHEHGFAGLLSMRFGNLLYPFNLAHPFPALAGHWREPYALATALQPLVFYQLIFALGPLLFVLFLLALAQKSRTAGMFRVASLFAYGSLVFAVLAIGCSSATWNHQWALPAFALSTAGAAGAVFARLRTVPALVFAAALAWNILFLVLGLWFGPGRALYLHADPCYLKLQAGVFCVFFVTAFSLVVLDSNDA